MELNGKTRNWIDFLAEEDLAFVKRFILSSGSLKEMAKAYGVSYPTVRLRLDRLIEKIKVVDDHVIVSEFEQTLRALFAEGRINMDTLKSLLTVHKKEMEANHETSNHRS